jgi:tetratricopeptide (TPR) repeat protein
MMKADMIRQLAACLAALAAAEAFAMQGAVSTETETFAGDVKWHARDKKYVIQKDKITKEFKLADVTSLDIPKPQGFDKAVQMVEAGQGSSAVAILAKIVSEYRMLQWDKPAGRYLALAHLAAGNAQKAYDACRPIIAEDKAAAYSGDLAAAYWQALLKLGKGEELEKLLKDAATKGNRQSSAAALVMRGDMIVAGSNDAPDELKRALRDGYLRVVLMYQDAECSRERGEAMLKAAQCFDKLGQSARAENLRTQAKSI